MDGKSLKIGLLVSCTWLGMIIACSNDKRTTDYKDLNTAEQLSEPEDQLLQDSIQAHLEPPPAEKIPRDYKPKNVKRANANDELTAEITDQQQKEKSINPPKKVSASIKKSSKKLAKIVFDNTTYEFGEILAGDVFEYNFNFTNTGNAPLEIKQVKPSCGCTAPSYPFIPILPGEKGFIGVRYNSVGKAGNQIADITVFSNGQPNTTKIFLKGLVLSKPVLESVSDSTSGLN